MSYNWERRFPATQPSRRANGQMAFDAARGNVVLFGGANPSNVDLDDTWIWDGTNWTEVFPSTTPTAAVDSGMVYDPIREVIVMFSLDIDTWEWDGTDWTNVVPANSPSGIQRLSFFMAWCELLGAIVMFGGLVDSGGGFVCVDETWKYDGDWTQLSPSTRPDPRAGVCAAPDPVGRVVILDGVNDSNLPFLETWRFDGSDWAEVITADMPPITLMSGGSDSTFAPYAPDSSGKILWYCSAHAPSTDAVVQQTWRFSGTNWVEESPINPGPSCRAANTIRQICYDDARKETVFFPYNNTASETWVWRAPPTGVYLAPAFIA